MSEAISLKDLKFETISPAKADNIKYGFLGGIKKKFAECVKDGNAAYYPVMATDNCCEYIRGPIENRREAEYCMLATRDGVRIKEKIATSRCAEFFGVSAFLDCDELLSEDGHEPYPAYIIRFVITGTTHYLVIDERELADFNVMLEAGDDIRNFDSVHED